MHRDRCIQLQERADRSQAGHPMIPGTSTLPPLAIRSLSMAGAVRSRTGPRSTLPPQCHPPEACTSMHCMLVSLQTQTPRQFEQLHLRHLR